ncbi:MAG: LPS assembly protein LptD [Planctomycetes bacterium]|jgi:hypothetical protein|nr:LPS assembly protein LptD [Planctomycetota bacterium]
MSTCNRRRQSALSCLPLALLAAVALHGVPSHLAAQEHPAPPPSANDALAEPIVSAEAVFRGQRATAWREGSTRFLLLEGDAGFDLGLYRFRAERAVVRVDPEALPGRTVNHLTIYLDETSSRREGATVHAEAERLLVTAATTGGLAVETDLFEEAEAAPDDPLVADAADRVQRHRLAMARPLIEPGELPDYEPGDDPVRTARREAIRQENRIGEVKIVEPSDDERPGVGVRPGARDDPREEPSGILPTRGVVRFNADRVVYEQANEQRDAALMLIGDVKVFYTDYDQDRTVSLVAQRVVIFMADRERRGNPPAPAVGREVAASAVAGVYLEDNAIITDGRYTVRAPRVFYDIEQNKAVLLEAVMFTDDLERQVPLYVRADVLRQTSADTFEARNARFTTSEFAEPHFAIGAQRVTIDRRPGVDGQPRNLVTAEKGSLQWYEQPILPLPKVKGEPGQIPLKRISVGADNNGARVQTRWDLFSLSGRQAPEGVELYGDVDYRGDHGPALGLELDYELPTFFGNARGYFLPIDDGTDEIGDRNDIEQDNEQRGFFQLQHRQYLDYGVELSLEGAYVSDETFLEEFFRGEAHSAKDYETSVYLKKQENEWALDLYARYDLNEFTPQLTTLQTPGYTVARAPELRYFRQGTPLFDGLINWYTENRVGALKLQVGDDEPADRGFTNADSLRFFGIANTTSFDDAADAAGLPGDWIARGDTRHELTLPLDFGPLDVTPYAVGRVTAWDSDFGDFNGQANEDNVRFWGGGGVRPGIEFSRTFKQVGNDLLDVHQLRHIIEPHTDLFWHGSTIDRDDLPVFDPEVEGLSEGGGVRVGMTNTLQTKRGGPGRWRSVDWVRLRTDLILRTDDADTDADVPRYYEYRPEYALGGDHFYTELLWMVTDTLGVMGDLTYNLEDTQTAQWRLGISLDHSPRLRSFVTYHEVDTLDSRILTYGFDYDLTSKYRLGFVHRLDFAENESRNIGLTLDRQLPRWTLRGVIDYDEIDSEAVVGFILVPQGFDIDASPITLLSAN